ncbi:seipin-1 [Cocos nucifera]|uniref:Seipin-1 n=1 Tax=Cocos nucifera TaxID=13894 RepID=A0A8K0NCU5_COCNU|nr:seipin-1 [Cocos nucifera]
MDPETHHRKRHRAQVAPIAAAAASSSPTSGDRAEEKNHEPDDGDLLLVFSEPVGWLVRAAAAPVELIVSALLSLAAPIVALREDSKTAPVRAARSGAALLRRLAAGLLGAAGAAVVLVFLSVAAVLLGVGLVRLWVGEPVSMRRPLHFDYTEPHPSGVAALGGTRRWRPVPAGHTARVSLVLIMPESDYNRGIGVFQVTAEAIAPNRDAITTFSQPCMLRFRSPPIRLMQACLMGIPLLMGMRTESQKITIEILRYKETSQTTEAIRVRLKPRAGTTDLPQVYAAEIFVNSQLPWGKEFVYNWKWTFYVWTSLYVYIVLLILWFCWFKPFSLVRHESFVVDRPSEGGEDMAATYKKDGEISDEMSKIIKRWRERRSKRKAPLSEMHLPELIEGSASSNLGEAREVIQDCSHFDEASKSSECVGGYVRKSK